MVWVDSAPDKTAVSSIGLDEPKGFVFCISWNWNSRVWDIYWSHWESKGEFLLIGHADELGTEKIAVEFDPIGGKVDCP